ncbi:MAG: hypothetical protein JWN70_1680 [Planctomycetaceae bacterium]|nr:hypothetical protein [Planctomycetaceae bacterium]
MTSHGRDSRDQISINLPSAEIAGSNCVRPSRTALNYTLHGTLTERRQLRLLFDDGLTAVAAPHFRTAIGWDAGDTHAADRSSEQATTPMETASTPPANSAAPAWSGRVALHSTPFAACAAEVGKLQVALSELEQSATLLQLPPLAEREWYETLTRKLIPQLSSEPFIVVAVVGGTNIGKSVLFNHLAGSRVSATSPLASGTKHPVCLVPTGFTANHNLSEIFQGFELEEWTQSESALKTDASDKLFWKESPSVPSNMLVLDTPDVDSDAAVNWHRADCIRHSADVLVAVLTQQKYNDAAVKQFFRKAGAEDKAVVVVFNQVLLPEDEDYWPLWLGTFTKETSITPEMVYVAPNDRRAAEANKLPFYVRPWPLPIESTSPDTKTATADRQLSAPHDLREDLSLLHFSSIKFRTIRGSLRQLVDEDSGIPAYLNEVRVRSGDFRSAAELLTGRQLARISNWPTIPNRLLVNEIRRWWRGQRQGWTKSVHDFYNSIGDGVLRTVRWARDRISGTEVDPIEQYQRAEHEVILTAIEDLLDGLNQLAELGNDLLRPRIARLLTGERRAALLERINSGHSQLQLEAELQDVVANQMRAFQSDSPQVFDLIKQLDGLAAAARPVTSVALFLVGGGPLGHAAAPVAHSLAFDAVLHIAGGTGAVLAGETALTGTTAGLRAVEAHFRQLHVAFTTHRLEWLGRQLKDNLLGTLQDELQSAAAIPDSAAFQNVRRVVESLRIQIS